MKKTVIAVCLAGLLSTSASMAQSNTVHDIQQQWAQISYQMPEDKQLDALKALVDTAKQRVANNPGDAASLTWLAIVQASTAKAKGGLGALDYAKAARDNFKRAIELDETVLEGSALTSLATLYHKVPGWPVSFGDDDEAESLFKRALEVNPQGIDANFFYAEFLFDDGDYQQARHYLEKASQAAPRPDRPLADEGRHKAIDELKTKVDKKLG
ncbi:tetratricopeptide repeat protein [Salinimonas lutimaris]|uniref:tetratricopeptide repeat protein n=1 Tax=Salinimonas lutimaris TaxID=914153 RepID=UPI0010C0F7C9|nr:tetratricopeptide repeat protein [Salinimonas lutimaris]